MDKIKAQLLRIQQQLAGLSATQKMLTASLVAIMLITLVYWGKSAGTAELEPVFNAPTSPEEATKAVSALQTAGINASYTGGQLLVPAEDKVRAGAMLAYNGAVPSAADPKDVLNLISPFDGPQKIQLTEKAVLEARLKSMFQRFPGVSNAEVILNNEKDNRIGAHNEPSASVSLFTRKNEAANKLLTLAVTNMVAQAVGGGLQPKNIAVDIDGIKQHTDSSGDDMTADDTEHRVLAFESEYEDKLAKQIGPGTLVSIKAVLDNETVHTESHLGDPEKSVSKEKKSETMTQETTTTSAASAEPGAVPNSSVALAGNSAPASPTVTSSTEKTTSENEVLIAHTDTLSDKLRGGILIKTAAVRLPLSKVLDHYRLRHPNVKDPSDEQLEPFKKAEFEADVKQVQMALFLNSPDNIAIDCYYDSPAPVEQPQEVAATATASIVSGYGKQAVLGLLAVASLFMVATMVKKGQPAPALPIAAAPMVDRGPMTLSALGELAGIVSDESSGTLEGVELDENQIKTSRVVDQVSTMVKENPEAAADLVKRWMART